MAWPIPGAGSTTLSGPMRQAQAAAAIPPTLISPESMKGGTSL